MISVLEMRTPELGRPRLYWGRFFWNTIVIDKQTIRDDIQRAIERLSSEERIVSDAHIGTHITHLPFWDEAKVVIGYIAMDDEVDLTAVLRTAIRDGKAVGLPRITSKGEAMTIRSVADFPIGLERHSFGLLQPHAEAPEITDLSSALFLVPGRAFDRTGRRIGRGAGYYDRYLQRSGAPLATIGVGYSVQLRTAIPSNERDQPVQIVITEDETCFCSRPRGNAVP